MGTAVLEECEARHRSSAARTDAAYSRHRWRILATKYITHEMQADRCKLKNEPERPSDLETRVLEALNAVENLPLHITGLIERYVNAHSLNEAEDAELTKHILVVLKHLEIDEKDTLKLVAALAAHLAESRPAFNDRACLVATALFKRDEFDMAEKECYAEFAAFLPANITGAKKIDPRPNGTTFAGYEVIKNDATGQIGQYRPLFIQQAIKILRSKRNTEEMKAVHARMDGILRRTSHRSLRNHATGLFEVLLDLNTPELYNCQFLSLALLIAKTTEFYDRALKIFFESDVETLRFYILHTFIRVHEMVAAEERVAMHIKFAEALMAHDGQFDPIVQEQIDYYVNMGIRLLSEAG